MIAQSQGAVNKLSNLVGTFNQLPIGLDQFTDLMGLLFHK